jgi:phospholipid/cholesterol/gamma-HCH transport system substrate-binding protein
MGKQTGDYIKLGIFVIIAFLVFTYGVYRIGEKDDLFGSNQFTVYADFKDVKGLEAGNRIRFSGITVGNVKSVSIINDTTLRVSMGLKEEAQEFLRTNAQVDIGTDGLVGNMVINIAPGYEEAPLVKDGDFLTVRKKAEIQEMLETLAVTNENINIITGHIMDITRKMNEGEGSMSLLINDKAMAQNLISTTKNLQNATDQVALTVNQIDQLVGQVSQGKGNLGYLFQDSTLKSQINSLSEELDSLIAIRTSPVLENLEVSSQAIASASQDIENLFSLLEGDDGLVQVLASDSTLSQDLRSTLFHLDEGMQKFNENMNAMQSNWLFRRYYREKAKQEKKEAKKEAASESN